MENYFFAFQIDAVVKVAAPKDKVVLLNTPVVRKCDATRDFGVVGVALRPLRLAGSKVAAHEAKRRVAEDKTDGHASLVACGSAQPRLDRIGGHVADEFRQFRPDENVQTDTDELDVRQQGKRSIPGQNFQQFCRPSLGVLAAGRHDVGRIEIDDFFKANRVNVRRTPVFRLAETHQRPAIPVSLEFSK